MLGLGWFRLRRGGKYGAGLVEVAAFVGGDGVEAGGEREAEAFEEGIGEADGGEVEVGVGAEEILGFGVRGEERGGGVSERRGCARLDVFGGFAFDFRGRLERADKPSAEKARERRAAAEFVFAARGGGQRLHCDEVDAICECEMIEAFGDAPCGGMRAPGGLGFGEIGDERVRVFLYCDERVVESLDFRIHYSRLHTLGYGNKRCLSILHGMERMFAGRPAGRVSVRWRGELG
jgi:hypothetical protein